MIRLARDDDAARLAEIHVTAWRRVCRHILPSEVLAGVSVEGRTRDWRRWLAQSGSWTLVSERAGQLVGFAALGVMRSNGRAVRSLVEIRRLYVDPAHWRQGMGRELHEALLAVARERGFTQLMLWVLSENQQARSFYAALGFEPDRTRRISIGGNSVDETRYCLPRGS